MFQFGVKFLSQWTVTVASVAFDMGASKLSEAEIDRVDSMQKAGRTPKQILSTLQRNRARRGGTGPGSTAVYDFLAGATHERGAEETRGRTAKMPRRLISTAAAARRRLIKNADNEWLVTWEDVHKETKKELKRTKLLKRGTRMPSEDWLARQVRAKSAVRARPPKRRLARTEKHEKQRFVQAGKWLRHSRDFWYNGVHCYIDNKRFLLCRTAKHKKLARSTRIKHHLRLPSEGGDQGFVVPKTGHMLLGVPSVEITAAVAKNRIIFWYVNQARWCGKQAVIMYTALGKALRKEYPTASSFTVVEDGDTKGYKSNLGLEAKKKEKIKTMTLPPRSPGMMPLDYCLWDEIEDRVLEKEVPDDETKQQYMQRLRMTALRLPQDLVKNTVMRMKANIKATKDSKGKNTIATGGLD